MPSTRTDELQENISAPTWIRTVTLLVIFFTGFTGLVYEVTWQRYLTNLLGSQAKASALILSVFLGGLCLGYLLFGRVSRSGSPRSLLRLTGWLEIGIGVWAILFHVFYEWVWRSIGIFPSGLEALPFEIGVTSLLLLPPTILMGSTLPLLTQGLSSDLNQSGPLHAVLYSVNTGGAFLGALVAGFVFLPLFGLPVTLSGSAPINILAGVILIFLSRRLSPEPPQSVAAQQSLPPSVFLRMDDPFDRFRAVLIAFLAGFYSLSLQTVLIRLTGLSVGSSEYAFAMIVAAYIFLLAFGSALLACQPKLSIWSLFRNQVVLFLSATCLYATVSYWPYSSHVLRTLFSSEFPTFYLYHGFLFLVLLLLLFVPVGCMGRTMPLLFGSARSELSSVGALVGSLYGWNTLGCVLGAFCGGYLAFFFLDLDQVFSVCLALMFCTLLVSSPDRRSIFSRSRIAVAFGLVAVLTVSLFSPQWTKPWLGRGTFRRRAADAVSYEGASQFYRTIAQTKLLFYRDGPNTTVAVYESRTPDRESSVRSIFVNGKSDGATKGGDLTTTRMLAHLPMLFQQSQSDRAAVVGFGTGITVGSLTLSDQLSAVDVIEISSAVRDAAPLFSDSNHGAVNHSRTRWHIEDAYRFFGKTEHSYAVIVSEPSNPWVTGIERLYTDEFYRIARARLAKGGVFAQWVQMYALSEETLGLILRTFQRNFASVRIFRFGKDAIILGSESPLIELPFSELVSRFTEPQIFAELQEIGLETVEMFLAHELPTVATIYPGSIVNTLMRPTLAFQAGIDFFQGSLPDIQGTLGSSHGRAILFSAMERLLAVRYHRAEKENFNYLGFLKSAIEHSCKTEELSKIEWRKVPILCKKYLTASSVVGEITEIAQPIGFHPQIVRYLAGAETGLSSEVKRANSTTVLDYYRDAISPLLPLSPNLLRNALQQCFSEVTPDTVVCRAGFAQALLEAGELSAAEQMMNHLKQHRDTLPANSLEEIQEMLAVAKQFRL